LKPKLFSVIKYLIFLSIGIILFWLAIKGLDLKLIFREIKNANYFWILLSFVPAIISFFSRGIRWNILIESLGYKTNTYTTTYAVIIGYFANYAVPRIGEITRCGIISKKNNIPLNALIGTVIVERVFDMICLLILTVLVVIFQIGFLGSFMNNKIFLPLLSKFSAYSNLLIIITIIFVVFLTLVVVFFKRYSQKLMKYKIYVKMYNLFKGFWDGIKSIKKIKHKKAFFFQTFLLWMMYLLMVYIAFFAIDGTSNLTIISALTLLVITTFGFVAPVPGGIGAYHWIMITTLIELYGVASEQAASFAVIAHASQMLLVIVVGLICFGFLFFLKKKKQHAIS
jgi:glycosyltransferase 2 family protein